MKVTPSKTEIREIRKTLNEPVGLVPTMGYLHEGHLSLVQAAFKECASVVVSIFVNPAQFGPREDLSAYPRDLERDLSMLEQENVDVVWTPEKEALYPPGFQTWITVEDLTEPLEGKIRRGHFRGVTTIVGKLFNVVQPQIAFFGQKDAQQAAVIRRMTEDLNFPVDIRVCPTIREPDGLAMSSRNSYLNPAERAAAGIIYQGLQAALIRCQSGESDANKIRDIMRSTIEKEPLARVEYVSCADPLTLRELDLVAGEALLSAAVFIGKTRLIDNVVYRGSA